MRYLLALLIPIELVLMVALVFLCWAAFTIHVEIPLQKGELVVVPTREAFTDLGWRSGEDRIARNDHGIWEAYVHGAPLERGVRYGVLAEELIQEQEELFVERISMLVPDERKLKWLKYFVSFFNRDLEDHVPLEFRREIYGVSRSFSHDFDMIGDRYSRALNYHGAHDIGHALQDLALVGCTSFAAWDSNTVDGNLLVGRNFDFDMGEAFACNKVLLFMRPDDGHAFAEMTWGGMMGAVSGMNVEGLTVTINASRSAVPTGARTPISLLAREILQYAATIEQAIAIAEKREVFVSESILIGSAHDGRAAIIEKAPDGLGVFDPGNGKLVCANHYQSETFLETEANRTNLEESDSRSRFDRMQRLLSAEKALDPLAAARILRDRSGPNGADVGLGNPIAINQLIAHHSVIFQPGSRRMWVSAGPYQLGAYLCYDLSAIFAQHGGTLPHPMYDSTATIPADPFLTSQEMDDFVWHRAMRNAIHERLITNSAKPLSAQDEAFFIATDPDNFDTYATLGRLYSALSRCGEAKAHFKAALQHTVSSRMEERRITEEMNACGTN